MEEKVVHGDLGDVCRYYCIKHEFISTKCPELSGVAERTRGIIRNALLVNPCQVLIRLPHVELPLSETFWAEAVYWACDALNHSSMVSNPGKKLPYKMCRGKAARTSPHPFLRPGYCRWNHPSKSCPRCKGSFCIGPGIDNLHDSLQMLMRAIKVVETRHITRKHCLHGAVGASAAASMVGAGGGIGDRRDVTAETDVGAGRHSRGGRDI